jgi:hypothetical protein
VGNQATAGAPAPGAASGAALERPTLLVGAERSGSTLLRLMLDHHPKIAFQSEFDFAVSQMTDEGSFPALDAFHAWLRRDRIFEDTHFGIDSSLSYPGLVRSFLEQKLARDAKQHVGATVHHHFARLPDLWPEARFIHLLRDPRDVARSCVGMGWAGNVWTGVEGWITAEREWERLRARVGDDRWIEIRYDDLVRDTPAQLDRACSLIGVDYDEAMLSYVEHSTYSRPDASLVEQWRRTLSEREIQLVEARVGTLLSARGYQPSGLPARMPSPLEVRLLELRSRWLTRRWRVQRFGFTLLAARKLSQWIHAEGLQERIQRRINDISRRHLR